MRALALVAVLLLSACGSPAAKPLKWHYESLGATCWTFSASIDCLPDSELNYVPPQ